MLMLVAISLAITGYVVDAWQHEQATTWGPDQEESSQLKISVPVAGTAWVRGVDVDGKGILTVFAREPAGTYTFILASHAGEVFKNSTCHLDAVIWQEATLLHGDSIIIAGYKMREDTPYPLVARLSLDGDVIWLKWFTQAMGYFTSLAAAGSSFVAAGLSTISSVIVMLDLTGEVSWTWTRPVEPYETASVMQRVDFDGTHVVAGGVQELHGSIIRWFVDILYKNGTRAYSHHVIGSFTHMDLEGSTVVVASNMAIDTLYRSENAGWKLLRRAEMPTSIPTPSIKAVMILPNGDCMICSDGCILLFEGIINVSLPDNILLVHTQHPTFIVKGRNLSLHSVIASISSVANASIHVVLVKLYVRGALNITINCLLMAWIFLLCCSSLVATCMLPSQEQQEENTILRTVVAFIVAGTAALVSTWKITIIELAVVGIMVGGLSMAPWGFVVLLALGNTIGQFFDNRRAARIRSLRDARYARHAHETVTVAGDVKRNEPASGKPRALPDDPLETLGLSPDARIRPRLSGGGSRGLGRTGRHDKSPNIISKHPTKVPKKSTGIGNQQSKEGKATGDKASTSPITRATVLAYVEKQRLAGTREFHRIQVVDAMDATTKQRLDKLYRVLGDLVDRGVLVRKRSAFVIVDISRKPR